MSSTGVITPLGREPRDYKTRAQDLCGSVLELDSTRNWFPPKVNMSPGMRYPLSLELQL